MKQNMPHDFPPVRLKLKTGIDDIIISSVEEAAEELLTDWPGDEGDRFYEAVKACFDCLQGQLGTEIVRQAFVQAAVEAGISVELEAGQLTKLETETSRAPMNR
ncbi:DUF982 domain-containing protein [Neorhizobium sp. LMR1-1-1.1]